MYMCTWGRPRADADQDAAWRHKKMSKTWVWALFRSWLSRRMDDGDDLEDNLGSPERIIWMPGRQTTSAFVRTDSISCLFCQSKKWPGPSSPSSFWSLRAVRRSLHSGHWSVQTREETRGFFWKFEGSICGPNCLINRSDNYSYTSFSTLKRPWIKYMKFSQLDDGGVEKARLERGLKGGFWYLA